MRKTNTALLIVVIVLVLLGGWYLWGPSGGNLTALTEGNFVQFTGEFQGAANDERMLILVSPT